MPLLRSAALAVPVAGPFTVSGAPRIVLGGVRGDRDGALGRQLAALLCGSFECAHRSSAYTANRPDLAKARRNGVSGIVVGALKESEQKRTLWLELLTTSSRPEHRWKLPVRANGRVARRSLAAIVPEIEKRLAAAGAAVAAEAGAPPPQATSEAAPAALGARTAPRAPEAQSGSATSAERLPAHHPDAIAAAPRPHSPGAAPPPSPAKLPPPPPPRDKPAGALARSGPRFGALELGADVTGRELGYGGTAPPGSASLQTMRVDAVLCPRLYVEIFPGAAVTRGPLAGIVAFADYRRSVGFEVRAGSEVLPARLARLGAGLGWRSPPVSRLRLGFSPAISYERRDVTLTRGAIPGLPNAHLRGVRIGSGLSVPIAARYALLFGAGYVFWTSSGDLVQGNVPFFPSGSASALEVEAGISVALRGPLSARIVGEYSSTRYSLDPDPTGAYRASRATDRYAGGRASIRAQF